MNQCVLCRCVVATIALCWSVLFSARSFGQDGWTPFDAPSPRDDLALVVPGGDLSAGWQHFGSAVEDFTPEPLIVRWWEPGRRPDAPPAADLDLPPPVRLPGEFEPQGAIVFACYELLDEIPDIFAQMVYHASGRAPLVALINDDEERLRATEALQQRRVSAAGVRFVEACHNTMWCRDYGPLVVKTRAGRPVLVDTDYVRDVRPQDDTVPAQLARLWNLPVISTNLRLEGGNLLSNGHGLCLTTTQTLELNIDLADETMVREVFRQCFGAEETLFLEPLQGESTGHVDMFATFVAPHIVVVGSYDPLVDPVNAQILDNNAHRLTGLRTPFGPLQVVRVPMPSNTEDVWRTYTNVVFANGLLFVPIYPGVSTAAQQQAMTTFAQLLPGHRVIGLDASAAIHLGGALHCVTLNLGPIRLAHP